MNLVPAVAVRWKLFAWIQTEFSSASTLRAAYPMLMDLETNATDVQMMGTRSNYVSAAAASMMTQMPDGDDVPDCVDACPGADDGVYGPEYLDMIPTISAWGLATLSLLLLITAKMAYRRRGIMYKHRFI